MKLLLRSYSNEEHDGLSFNLNRNRKSQRVTTASSQSLLLIVSKYSIQVISVLKAFDCSNRIEAIFMITTSFWRNSEKCSISFKSV